MANQIREYINAARAVKPATAAHSQAAQALREAEATRDHAIAAGGDAHSAVTDWVHAVGMADRANARLGEAVERLEAAEQALRELGAEITED